ncbi:MAG: amidohydrolase family protein [Planctomycetes bacterium]|nr:amidohydrolase family protein [Planctomycetota bacterium]
MILQGRLLASADELPRPGWLRVDEGRIAEIGDGPPPEEPTAGGADAIICPGFVDAHIHLPQLDAVGCDGLDLLAWLNEVIFPAELRWSDPVVARADLHQAYRRMLRAGTLGYAGYLTSHHHGVVAVIGVAQQCSLRSVVGQVMMDRYAPDALLINPGTHDHAGQADRPGQPAPLARLAESARGRLKLSVNPRFAVACSETLLARAAVRAKGDIFVQTHLAETRRECELVRELFPDDPHYAGVYDRHGLLGERTLLAHCVHLDLDQWRLIARRRSIVVHCPTANTFLRSGLFDLDAARAHGVRLALGSDVAAGPDTAMPRVARAMIETAKVRAMTAPAGQSVHVPTPGEVWTMITRGNALALGFTDMGRLVPGAAADLLVLRAQVPIDRHLIGRLIYTWRDDYIDAIVLNGRLIDPNGS